MGVMGLSIAYASLGVLLLGLLLRSRWPSTVKLGAVVLTSMFYVASYFSLHSLTGWPSNRLPPSRFQLIAAAVHEPDAIYLWVRTLDDPDAKPRSHVLAYDRRLHEDVRQARNRLRAGQPQMGERGPQSGAGSAAGSDLRFTDLPRRYLPPKP